MSVPESMIDMIVREVMRQLAADRAAGDRASVTDQMTGSLKETRSLARLSCRVVTEEMLRGLGNGITRVEIAPKCVLTPSARDYLRLHGIGVTSSLARHQPQSAQPKSPEPRTAVRTSAATTREIIVIGSLTASQQFTAPGWKAIHESCEKQSVSRVQQAAGNDEGFRAMTVSTLPSVTAYRLNRCRDCRAAVVTAECDLNALFEVMKPNIVCVSNHGLSWTKRRDLLRRLENKVRADSSVVTVSSNGRGLPS